MRLLLTAWALAAAGWAAAQFQEVQVAVLHGKGVTSATLMGIRGAMAVLADGRQVGELAPNDGLRVALEDGRLVGRSLSATWTARDRITLRAPSGGGVRLRAVVPKVPERVYSGSIDIRRSGAELRFVNEVKLEDYVAGVVESEAGAQQAPEYYKLQAVGCRTYALANARKHAPEGFELCDQVHCQVYKGRATHAPITEAALATRGMVVVDADIRLIHATFHSNCGGETLNAEDIWSRSEPYLQATTDSFCIAQPHATWTTTIPKADWLSYMERKHGLRIADEAVRAELLAHEPQCRGLYLNTTKPLVPLKQVREDWKLRSTYFTVRTTGDQVVLDGRGFGHGVGLCQEGAMEMARRGIPFLDILHHYYRDVHLVDLSSLEFFRDEGE
ncbi:MAG: SpoIID/LytB domain-containing protein [Flavobacteriales bacterium]|nr:SpoIID/LytB domain-containing protein [Flavobacteriales bacterium]